MKNFNLYIKCPADAVQASGYVNERFTFDVVIRDVRFIPAWNQAVVSVDIDERDTNALQSWFGETMSAECLKGVGYPMGSLIGWNDGK